MSRSVNLRSSCYAHKLLRASHGSGMFVAIYLDVESVSLLFVIRLNNWFIDGFSYTECLGNEEKLGETYTCTTLPIAGEAATMLITSQTTEARIDH